MKKLIIVAGVLAAGLIVGCGRNDGQKVPVAEGFEIPRSLVTQQVVVSGIFHHNLLI